MLADIASRVRDLSHVFSPGFVPVNDDDRRRAGAVAATASLDPLHVVAPDQTYFVSIDAQGRRCYSRDGAFTLQNGELRTRDGAAVVGYPAGDGDMGPLQTDRVDAALGRVSDARLDANGYLSYVRTPVDPRTGSAKPERVTVGRVVLARFPSGVQLDAADGVHVTAPAGVEPHLAAAGTDGLGNVIPQSDDLGGVDMKRGLMHLRDAYLAFNALQSAKSVSGKNDKLVMDLVK